MNSGPGEKNIIEAIASVLEGGKGKLIIVDENGNIISDAKLSTIGSTLSSVNTILDALKKALNSVKEDSILTTLQGSTIKQPVDIQDHWSESVILLASGARTASGNSVDVDVGRFVAGEICVDVTAVSGTFATGQGLEVFVEGKDPITGKYRTIFDTGLITSVTTLWKTVSLCTEPSLAYRYLRVRWTISGTNPSFTFSVTMPAKG